MADDINQNINNLYKNEGFFDIYLSDALIAFFLCLLFLLGFMYFHTMNHIKPIIADWSNQRCSPSVIPFAGLINNGPTTTPLEFTTNNFTSCMHTAISSMTANIFQPLNYLINSFSKVFNDLSEAMVAVRAEFDKIRNTIQMFSSDVMDRGLNITMPILNMIIGMKTMMAKVTGVLAATQYTLFGSYLSLKSLFLYFINVINDILIGLVASIVALFIIGILFPPIELVALGSSAIMLAILVPTILIQQFISNIFKVHTASLPSVPTCFAGDTLIELADKSQKKISDIRVGELLQNGGRVSATLECLAAGQHMYLLDGIRVTGEHRVFHIEKQTWIKVNMHERSVLVSGFNELFVYCLNTEEKTFRINNTLFSDWDDIDAAVLFQLKEKCGDLRNGRDIHVQLDNGLDGDLTIIKLKNGSKVLLKDIKVNDVLYYGEKVIGVVKIDMTDIKDIYDYYIYDSISLSILKRISGCKNIQLSINADAHLHIKTKRKKIVNIKDVFYQLLIEGGGGFILEDIGDNIQIKIGDYNTGLDKFLV